MYEGIGAKAMNAATKQEIVTYSKPGGWFAALATLIRKDAAPEDEKHPVPAGFFEPMMRVACETSGRDLAADGARNSPPLPPRIGFILAMAHGMSS